MKKIFSAAVLTLFVGLALTGCAGSPAPTPVQTESVGSTAKIDESQQGKLVTAFKKIDPALGTERAVNDARQECHHIQRGDSDAKQLAFARDLLITNTKIKPGPDTDAAAKKIIEAIKSNGFCQTGV